MPGSNITEIVPIQQEGSSVKELELTPVEAQPIPKSGKDIFIPKL